MEFFYELSLMLIIAVFISTFAKILKQPLIIGYIFTGLIVGPYFLNILKSIEMVEFLSKLGITSLLFIVGLGLNPKVLKDLGLVSLVTGMGQIIFTSLIGFLISLALGFNIVSSIYISIALTFSSTIIVLKLLSDKGDLGKMYGQISIGFLLVQDIVATIILVIVSGISTLQGTNIYEILLNLFLLISKGVLLLILIFVFSTKILSRFNKFISDSQEYLFIFATSWGMFISYLYYISGLSIEIGALVAGITLSMTPYSYEVASRLRPLRDFFIILFFILLGSQMTFLNIVNLIVPSTILSLFVLIGNPLIVFILMNFLGYTKKTSFMAGLTVAQISEFSLILISLALKVKHINSDILSLITLVGVITISGSSYLILYSEKIYKKISKFLNFFTIKKNIYDKTSKHPVYHAIIFGYKRAGPEFSKVFDDMNLKYLVVDINPDVIEHLENLKIPCEYGDATDAEFLLDLPFSKCKIVISTMPDHEANLLVVRTVRKINETTIVVVMADTTSNAKRLYEEGASNVILTQYVGAKKASEMIKKFEFDKDKYQKEKLKDIKYWNIDYTTL